MISVFARLMSLNVYILIKIIIIVQQYERRKNEAPSTSTMCPNAITFQDGGALDRGHHFLRCVCRLLAKTIFGRSVQEQLLDHPGSASFDSPSCKECCPSFSS